MLTVEQLNAMVIATLMTYKNMTRGEAEHWIALLPDTVKLHHAMIATGILLAAQMVQDYSDTPVPYHQRCDIARAVRLAVCPVVA
jgi:hypothetical protein